MNHEQLKSTREVVPPALNDSGDEADHARQDNTNSRRGRSQSSTGMPHEPIHLKWDKLKYFVEVPDADNKDKKATVEKQILFNISGDAKPGEMVAIMGSSGAGKTTLLKLLSGRVYGGRQVGSITVNGKKRTRSYRRRAAFVEQSDDLFANLTVRETLDFTAQLRLPPEISATQKKRHVERVIDELGLERCADTFVGGPLMPGVSGGEKRRVSMGVEVITSPSLIFLDEPTSGLDSTTAYRVIRTVKRLARRGRTVVVTIHQPKASIFAMFDKVVLLAQGKTVFFGTPGQALTHFESNGYKCPAFSNPADFFLDVCTPDGESKERDQYVQSAIDKLVRTYQEAEEKGTYIDPNAHTDNRLMELLNSEVYHAGSPALDEDLAAANGQPDASENVTIEMDDMAKENGDGGNAPEQEALTTKEDANSGVLFNNNWFVETSILTARNFLNFKREKIVTVFAAFQTVFIGVLLGVVFFQLGKGQTDIQNRAGVIFFLILNQSFGPLFQTVNVFLADRPIFRKERAAGAYRVSSYFIAKNVSEFPLQMLWPVLIATIVYWMAGLQREADKFFIFILVIIVTAFTAQSIGLLIGAVVPSIQVAQVLSPVVLLSFILVGGFFLNASDIPAWFIWLKWVSYINYSFRAGMQNEFGGLTFDACPPATGNSTQQACFQNGQEVIDLYDVGEPSIAVSLLLNIIIACFFRLGAYIALRTKDKPRMKLD